MSFATSSPPRRTVALPDSKTKKPTPPSPSLTIESPAWYSRRLVVAAIAEIAIRETLEQINRLEKRLGLVHHAELPPEPQQPPAYASRSPFSVPHSAFRDPSSDSPPSPEQLVEALLFAGGPPLTATAFVKLTGTSVAPRVLLPQATTEATPNI